MPANYRIAPSLNLIVCVIHGYCTIPELLQMEREVFQDPLRHPNMKVLVDGFQSDLEIELTEIHALIKSRKDLNEGGWEMEPTLLLTHNRILETFSRTYELLAYDVPLKLKIAHDLADGLRWLELIEQKARIAEILAELHLRAN